jgi:trehalose/maltose transport system permease protein
MATTETAIASPAARAVATPAARGRPSPVVRQRVRTAWLLLLPTLIVLAAVAGWPLGRTIWFSFTDATLSDLSGWRFIGLENYIGPGGVLADREWWNAVGNTVLFAVISVSLETTLGLGVALLLNHPSRLRTLLRATLLVPWAIPTVVSARMWSWMLHDQFGVVNHHLMALGLISTPLAFTADPNLSLLTVVMVDVWKTTPFMALLILAALQLVPSDCYEAAQVDGVPAWRVFRSVTLPLVLPGIAVAAVFRLLDALRIFDLIYVMTSNSRSSKSMSLYVREQLIDFQQVGYGSAAATLLFLVIAVVTMGYLTFARSSLKGAE